jgi:hypothetical protein
MCPVVLKGSPLAIRLYGDVGARPSSDIDLFVPAESRNAARRSLQLQGWIRTEGDGTGDEAFALKLPERSVHLEVHSTLLHPRFSYLRVPPPQARPLVLFGVEVPAHDDELVPGYLAAHLATHRQPPLLWFVDFSVVWERLDQQQRDAAVRAATAVGLSRYLRWAVEKTDSVLEAIDNRAAMRSFGFRKADRRDVHPMWRHIRLAPSTRARYFAVAAWLAPPWVDRTASGVVVEVARRIGRHGAEALGFRPSQPRLKTANALPAKVITLNGSELLSGLRETIATGGAAWCRVSGQSMAPMIADGDEVLLVPPTRPVRVGHIVLTETSRGPLLHRVITASPASILTRGDSSFTNDVAIRPSDIVGLAEIVRTGGITVVLRPGLRHGLRPFFRYLSRRLRTHFAMISRAPRRSVL